MAPLYLLYLPIVCSMQDYCCSLYRAPHRSSTHSLAHRLKHVLDWSIFGGTGFVSGVGSPLPPKVRLPLEAMRLDRVLNLSVCHFACVASACYEPQQNACAQGQAQRPVWSASVQAPSLCARAWLVSASGSLLDWRSRSSVNFCVYSSRQKPPLAVRKHNCMPLAPSSCLVFEQWNRFVKDIPEDPSKHA